MPNAEIWYGVGGSGGKTKVTSNLPTDWTFHFGIKSPPTQAAFTEAMETVKNAWIFIGLITQWALQWVPGLGIHLIRVFHGMENFS